MTITLDAQPAPFSFDPTTSAVLVVDMQNDFGAASGMLDRLGFGFHRIDQGT